MDLRRTPSLTPILRFLAATTALASVVGCATTLGDSGGGGGDLTTTTTMYVPPPLLAPVCDWLSLDSLVDLVPEGWDGPIDGPTPTQEHTHCAWEGADESGNLKHQLRLIVDHEIDRFGEDNPPPRQRAEQRFDAGQQVMLDDASRGTNTNVRTLYDLGDEAVASDYPGGVRLFARRGGTVIEISYSAADRSPGNIQEVVTALAGPLLDAYPDPVPG